MNVLNGKVFNAVSGFDLLVWTGEAVSGLDNSEKDPRTAVGLNRAGNKLIIIVVDGRPHTGYLNPPATDTGFEFELKDTAEKIFIRWSMLGEYERRRLRKQFGLPEEGGNAKHWGRQVKVVRFTLRDGIEYVEDGTTKLLEVPLTPADFALTEGRFKKQFRRLAADAVGVPVYEYIELSATEREGKTPFVWSTDEDKKLIKMEASQTLIHLVQERRKYWRTLQYLSGIDVVKLDADHRTELEALQHQYKESVEARESSIDSIARAMSELAASSDAPFSNGFSAALLSGSSASAKAGAPSAAPAANGSAVVTLAEEDLAKCNNCKTCYQDLSELFEKTRIVVDGVSKEVAHLIPGAVDRIEITPELKSKLARVAANCDAEIIHVH